MTTDPAASGNNAPHTVRCAEAGCPAETVLTVREYHPALRGSALAERGWSAPIIDKKVRNLCPAHSGTRRN